MLQYDEHKLNSEGCRNNITAVTDALYVLNGKWKLPIIAALSDGPLRFNELQRALEHITPKVLANELRELELNELVKRVVLPTVPVSITYERTEYAGTLRNVLGSLYEWGHEHRQRIIASRRLKLNASS